MAEQGAVKWFNDAKGYGFIVREQGPDVFVHHASIIAEGFRTLAEGDRVEFEVVEGKKGLEAQGRAEDLLEIFFARGEQLSRNLRLTFAPLPPTLLFTRRK